MDQDICLKCGHVQNKTKHINHPYEYDEIVEFCEHCGSTFIISLDHLKIHVNKVTSLLEKNKEAYQVETILDARDE